MEVKNQDSKNNDQNSLQAKELQKFFNDVLGVILIPKDKFVDYSILCVLTTQETYLNFKDYNIHKTILKLLDDKYPILSIRVDENSNFIGLSIIDKESGLKFKLPDQPVGNDLLTFLEARKYHDKICLAIGFLKGGNIVFDPKLKSNVLLILDGYIFE